MNHPRSRPITRNHRYEQTAREIDAQIAAARGLHIDDVTQTREQIPCEWRVLRDDALQDISPRPHVILNVPVEDTPESDWRITAAMAAVIIFLLFGLPLLEMWLQ